MLWLKYIAIDVKSKRIDSSVSGEIFMTGAGTTLVSILVM